MIPFLELQAFGFNILDIIIVVVLLLYAFEGYQLGFVGALFDFLSFVLSFALGLKFYSVIATLLVQKFSLSQGFANALGFFIVAFVSEIVLNILAHKIATFIHKHVVVKTTNDSSKAGYFALGNHIVGILPGVASAIVLVSFLLTIIISLPLSPYLKNLISSSRLGNPLVAKAQGFEKSLHTVFGGAVSDTLNFLTVEPQSNETVKLHFKATDVKPDSEAEQQMMRLVNKERTSRGLKPLVFDIRLQAVARAHAKDMFERGYFSHYTPEGLSPFDRIIQADISFVSAGENLALAPNTQLAMQGLMQSPGHRANILSTQFGKIGIGVMDGGIYGEMFTQEFKD